MILIVLFSKNKLMAWHTATLRFAYYVGLVLVGTKSQNQIILHVLKCIHNLINAL